MRVLVCGSRTFTEWPSKGFLIYTLLSALYRGKGANEFVLIEGGAPGADKHADFWARLIPEAERKENGGLFEHLPFPADWDRYGKAAGPIRNQQMLDEGKPDICYAFIDKPLEQSLGTKDMVDRCKKAEVKYTVIQVDTWRPDFHEAQ